MALKVMGSMTPATLALGTADAQVPRPAPMKLCAALFERFAGRSSVKRMLVSAAVFGFVTVK